MRRAALFRRIDASPVEELGPHSETRRDRLWNRTSNRLPSQLNARHVFWSGVAGILIVLVAGAITYLFTRPHGSSQWDDVIRSVVLAVAAMGAFPAAYVAYRKQRFTEADHQLDQEKEDHRRAEAAAANARRIEEINAANLRADARGFADRFTVVAGQIGADKAPVRLAGMYAMAQLADEWGRIDPAQRQTCIDVLCSYLRMPWPSGEVARLLPNPANIAPLPAGTWPRRLAGRGHRPAAIPEQPNPIDARIREEETRVREAVLRGVGPRTQRPRDRFLA